MTTFSTQPNLWSDPYEPSSSPEYSSQPMDILLYFTLAFMGLAVFSFCLQIALNIHREVRATRHQETNQEAQDPENRIASRPLSLAQVKTFPIKVYVSPAARKQKLRDRVAREQQRGESVPGSVAIPVVDGNLVDEENEEAPCCSVCLEDFVEYEVLRELPCKHLFHRRVRTTAEYAMNLLIRISEWLCSVYRSMAGEVESLSNMPFQRASKNQM
ncbi:hypothetical protein BCR33DRAFT_853481 [Rhizoclosmatium globosum]|uniref:RING-type domain-containing protein n=1 Tax=Rhizoclosmatium globosum TaxID=329046 RepID=A0A1Y2BXF0_9FUNG|nr:hypothetical protein BCR33DRAFT_853481 [Rhizoclosmatium globosum]|eukprot:ORY39327.1 hypothetical protein BCR33DRAFT_853481 [Rhizoclosmatium globosum]